MPNLQERQFTTKQRKMLAKTGAAMADGSFPIENTADLENAVKAYGRSPDEATKAHIVKRAKALKATKMLPADWKVAESAAPAVAEALANDSTDSTLAGIRDDFAEQFPAGNMPMGGYDPAPAIVDIYLADKYVVVCDDDDYYRVDFTLGADGEYDFADTSQWKELKLGYTDAGAGGEPAAPSESQRYTETARVGLKLKAELTTRVMVELASLREATVEPSDTGATIRNVTLIKPGFSTNTDKAGRPRYYPAATLKAAVAHFEGVRAYVNHPSKSQVNDLPERSILDIAGYWTNIRASDAGALVGDLKTMKNYAGQNVLPLIQEAIESHPGLVDVSINALGKTKIGEAEGRAAVVVESIVGANSVDIVTTGAAGGSFAGALLASDGGESITRQLLAALSFDEWRTAHPDYVVKIKKEWTTVRESEALKEAQTHAHGLQTKLAEAQAQHRAALAELADFRRGGTADRLLSESGLPHTLRTAVRAQLMEAKDEAGMQAVLEREQDKWRAAPKPVEVTGAGQRPITAAAPIAPAKPANLLGVAESMAVLPGENAEAYRVRRERARLKESQH